MTGVLVHLTKPMFYLFVALTSNLTWASNDAQGDGLERAQEHAMKVVKSCMEYGLESAQRMMLTMSPEEQKKMEQFLEDYYDSQIKNCLEILSFKLKQAADSIE